MRPRQCEVLVRTPDGHEFKTVVHASSVFHAAIQLPAALSNAALGPAGVKFTRETVVEIRPVYQVKLGSALDWTNQQAAKPFPRAKERKPVAIPRESCSGV